MPAANTRQAGRHPPPIDALDTGGTPMTDHHSTDVEEAADQQSSGEAKHLSRRGWLGMAGLGAGVARRKLISRPGAAANDGDNVSVGSTFPGDTATSFREHHDHGRHRRPPTPSRESSTRRRTGATASSATAGDSHAVAGGMSSSTTLAQRHLGPSPRRPAPESREPGHGHRHRRPGQRGQGGSSPGVQREPAVLGITAGGHAVAGDIEATAPNTVAATWGRHKGTGAGIRGISVSGYGGSSSEEGIGTADPEHRRRSRPTPTDTGHRGELYVDGVGDIYYNVSDGSNFHEAQLPGRNEPVRRSRTGLRFTFAVNKFGAGETRKVNLAATTSLPPAPGKRSSTSPSPIPTATDTSRSTTGTRRPGPTPRR
ncbi:MAG: hypothetical protein R2705_13315 [Ilumatobacteraceae bacterium]